MILGRSVRTAITPASLAVLALVVSTVLGFQAEPAGAQSAHCGRTLVLLGDSQADLLKKCGPPTRRLRAGKGGVSSQTGRSSSRGSARSRGGRGRETWVYDLGSRQLVRLITVERGRVVAIEFGDYGG